jgi:hypothetical protein
MAGQNERSAILCRMVELFVILQKGKWVERLCLLEALHPVLQEE